MVKFNSLCIMEIGDPIIVYETKPLRKIAKGTINQVLYSRCFNADENKKNGIILSGINVKYANGEIHYFSFDQYFFKLNQDNNWGSFENNKRNDVIFQIPVVGIKRNCSNCRLSGKDDSNCNCDIIKIED